MKKIIIVSALCLLILASCDSSVTKESEAKVTADTGVQTTAVETTQEKSDVLFVCELKNGVKITLGANSDSVIPSLGEYNDYVEAPSCVHEGSDKVYTYNGYSVMTSPDTNGEFVYQLNILTDEVCISNGITIGSSKADVISAYGECSNEKFGTMTYELDGAVLAITVDGDIVSAIVFTAK